jgi:hypothetical protein
MTLDNVSTRLTLKVSLKTEEDIEAAVEFFNNTIQWAGWNAMPQHTDTVKTYDCPILITTRNHPHHLYWLLGRKSKLSTNNKPLLYKAILKPIWTYRILLWGMASTSNIEILERFQSQTLRL